MFRAMPTPLNRLRDAADTVRVLAVGAVVSVAMVAWAFWSSPRNPLYLGAPVLPDTTPPAEPCPHCGASVYQPRYDTRRGWLWTCAGCGMEPPPPASGADALTR